MLDNPSFEDPDPADPGLALSWAITVTASFVFAGYELDSGLFRAWDAFDDGWVVDYAFATEADTAAIYNVSLELPAPARETFIVGWFSGVYLFDLGAMTQALYSGGAYETFSVSWGSNVHLTTLGSMTAAGADTFSSGWFTGAYATTLGSMNAADYNAGADAFENFEDVLAPIPFTATPTSDTFTAIAHGLSNGTRVLVVSDGQLPSGLNHMAAYFVIGATADTFQLSATSGGSAVDIGNQGTGAHQVISDGLTDWGLILT